MKRFIKIVCLLLTVVIALPVTAFATEERASNFFAITSTYLEKVSGTTFEVWFDVTAVDTMDELGVKTIKIQRSSDKTNWSTMKTYSKDNYSQMIDANAVSHADCVTYTGSVGYYYRAYVVFYAKDGSNIGEYSMYTSTIKVP